MLSHCCPASSPLTGMESHVDLVYTGILLQIFLTCNTTDSAPLLAATGSEHANVTRDQCSVVALSSSDSSVAL